MGILPLVIRIAVQLTVPEIIPNFKWSSCRGRSPELKSPRGQARAQSGVGALGELMLGEDEAEFLVPHLQIQGTDW